MRPPCHRSPDSMERCDHRPRESSRRRRTHMTSLGKMFASRFRNAGRWSATGLGVLALIGVLGAVGQAAADDCVKLGGVDGAECVISGVVAPPKTGTFNL